MLQDKCYGLETEARARRPTDEDQFSSVQLLSRVRLFATPWTAARQALLRRRQWYPGGAWWASVYGVAQSRSWLKRLSSSSRPRCPSPSPGVHSNSCPSSWYAIQPSHPLSSPSPPAPNASQHQSLINESTLRKRWPKYWSFSFSISPSNEHRGLISFRMDWLDLLAV